MRQFEFATTILSFHETTLAFRPRTFCANENPHFLFRQVNGCVLQGRCHLNASALIKGMIGTCFKIIVYR